MSWDLEHVFIELAFHFFAVSLARLHWTIAELLLLVVSAISEATGAATVIP